MLFSFIFGCHVHCNTFRFMLRKFRFIHRSKAIWMVSKLQFSVFIKVLNTFPDPVIIVWFVLVYIILPVHKKINLFIILKVNMVLSSYEAGQGILVIPHLPGLARGLGSKLGCYFLDVNVAMGTTPMSQILSLTMLANKHVMYS